MVGAGLAGLRACETLRRQGYEGRLRLVGEEKHLPYDRPPLSKQLLAGSWDSDRCTLKTAAGARDARHRARPRHESGAVRLGRAPSP